MAQRRPARKRRTRQHVIGDLSRNHVERYVLLCGCTAERVEHDYGFDLVLFTYDERGEIENGHVFIQLKATESLRLLGDQDTIAISVDRRDLALWLSEPMPVILIVYEARDDRAYWLYVQAYFESRPEFDLKSAGDTMTVHIQRSRLVNEDAIRNFARYRDDVLAQAQGVIRHHE